MTGLIYCLPWLCLVTVIFTFIISALLLLGGVEDPSDKREWLNFCEKDIAYKFMVKTCIISFILLFITTQLAIIYYFSH